MDLVKWGTKPFPLRPREPPSLHDLLECPGAEMRPELGLVRTKNRHVDVVVLPRLAPQEEIDRPSSGDVPGAQKPSHQSGNLEDGTERRHGPRLFLRPPSHLAEARASVVRNSFENL